MDLTWAKARAPVRVLDAGGWTDTWFAAEGLVCHLCVDPGAEAFVRKSPCRDDGQVHVRMSVPDFGDDYSFPAEAVPERHPLLEAALRRWAPKGWDLEVEVSSSVPAGSSLGTSASVVVALITALMALDAVEDGPDGLARAAHEVETVDLGRQSGVQDQVAAAFGGANLVEVAPYPNFKVEKLAVAAPAGGALGSRLVTVYLGPHDSSEVHTAVIEHLTNDQAAADKVLGSLRDAAAAAADALVKGDLEAYGEAMVANTEAQALLHPMLVNPLAQHVIELASRHRALGWKVNGAGGPGGSLSLIAPEDPGELVEALGKVDGAAVLVLGPAQKGARLVDAG
ncbi:MAG TPA: hypothetical protein VL984_03655 [Acidimicrobiales bacterium]|nr:hypothetical protein [Acidimicrobiales bacterium]